MNRNQKAALIGGITIIILSLLVWLFNGGEVFTKTQVLVEKQDLLFGTSYKEWEDKLIWGLDITLGISFFSVLTSLTIIYLFRNRRKEIV